MLDSSRWVPACIAVLLGAAAIPSPAQTLTTLVSFRGTNGSDPEYVSLAQGSDGNYYGTTTLGGANGYGTVFKMAPAGGLATLYSFDSTHGGSPFAGLIQATDGNFYGTTYGGGGANAGTIFRITPAGVLTTLYNFDNTHGAGPYAGLLQASDGNLYGTTYNGGDSSLGTVFQITLGGTLTTLHSFTGADGANPVAGLVEGTDGNFYGVTYGGGAHSLGTIFQITAGGALTMLYSFDTTHGANPAGRLVQGSDSNFYGTTYGGGNNSAGTVFRVTAGGALTTLHSLSPKTDGANPVAGLIQASDGNFYGTAYYGGAGNAGTIFKITTGGTLTTVHSFNSTDGANPAAALLQSSSGTFYGTTYDGGASKFGTVFTLSVASNIVYHLTGTLGPKLSSGPDCQSLNGASANVSVVASPSLVANSTTSTTTTYLLPAGAVNATLGSLTFTSNTQWKLNYALTSSADILTLSGVDPAGSSFTLKSSLVVGSFPGSVLGKTGHPAPLAPAHQPQNFTSPASYLTNSCTGSATPSFGFTGTISSTPAAPPAGR